MAFQLIPRPQSLKPARGGFTAGLTTAVSISGGDATPAEFLKDAVADLTGFSLAVDFAKTKSHFFSISAKEKSAPLLKRARTALAKLPDSPEAYSLIVAPSGIAAAAKGAPGLFYAAATAAQLLEKKDGRPFWPSCTITDWPDLAFRAVHLDLKHHLEKPSYFNSLVPRLASFKINALVLEIEDKFAYTRRPEIAAPLALSADDLRAFVALCGKYHVEFVPLVQGLGHASYILKHKKYAHLREKRGALAEFCPQAKETYEILFDLYEEVADACKGVKYFHIGGDEAWLVGSCPKCRQALKKRKKIDLFLDWLHPCVEKVKSLGFTPMVWDDMLISHAGDDYSTLPKDLFYVRWNYRPNAAELCADHVRRYAGSGLKVIVAAAIQTGYAYLPRYHDHFANIEGFAKSAARAGLAGILTTAWEDSGNHTESFWPGFAATGHVAWNAAADLGGDFLIDFTHVFHRTENAKLAAVYKTLGSAGPRVFHLLSPEEPYDCEKMYALPALVPASEGNRWRDLHAERIASATELAATLGEAVKVLSAEILSAKLANSYALDVLLAAARLMLSRVSLFFALRDCELSVESAHVDFAAGKKAPASETLRLAAVHIQKALDAGESALSSLSAVWEKTRFPQDMALFETPTHKYIHDYTNYRHLAAKTRDLSYHLFVERRIGARQLADSLSKGARDLGAAKAWPWE